MAKNLLNKYVWLVETIYKAKKISFEEILSMGSDIEVLSPDWFRDDIAKDIKHTWNKYKEG